MKYSEFINEATKNLADLSKDEKAIIDIWQKGHMEATAGRGWKFKASAYRNITGAVQAAAKAIGASKIEKIPFALGHRFKFNGITLVHSKSSKDFITFGDFTPQIALIRELED